MLFWVLKQVIQEENRNGPLICSNYGELFLFLKFVYVFNNSFFLQRLNEFKKDQCELENLSNMEQDDLLQYFLVSVRKTTLEPYPPRTLKEIICGIQYYFQKVFHRNLSILNDEEFRKTRNRAI